MRAMILAAGLGERLRPHTLKCAKPALPFLNLPLICYPWYHLQKVGASELIVNTHHCADSIKHAVQLFGLSHVQFIHESPLILGSGGGIKNARDDLAGDRHFLVANGDEVLLDPSGVDELWRRHTSEDNLATLLVCQFPGVGTKFGGVWCDPTERVINFGKTPDSEGLVGFHYTGFIALSDRVFDYLPAGQISNILYDGLASGMAKGEVVKVHRAEPYWFETGSEADYLSASQNCLKHLIDGDPQEFSLRNSIITMAGCFFPMDPKCSSARIANWIQISLLGDLAYWVRGFP